jgi:hypothetical protein
MCFLKAVAGKADFYRHISCNDRNPANAALSEDGAMFKIARF